MKKLLLLSTVSMVAAGLLGFVQLLSDVADGTMIDYEKQEATVTQQPVPVAVVAEKGQAVLPSGTRMVENNRVKQVNVTEIVPALFSRASIGIAADFRTSLLKVLVSGTGNTLHPFRFASVKEQPGRTNRYDALIALRLLHPGKGLAELQPSSAKQFFYVEGAALLPKEIRFRISRA